MGEGERAGEIVSVLYGPRASIRSVALDPLPEMVAEEAVGLVSVSRKRFVEHLVGRGEPENSGSKR